MRVVWSFEPISSAFSTQISPNGSTFLALCPNLTRSCSRNSDLSRYLLKMMIFSLLRWRGSIGGEWNNTVILYWSLSPLEKLPEKSELRFYNRPAALELPKHQCTVHRKFRLQKDLKKVFCSFRETQVICCNTFLPFTNKNWLYKIYNFVLKPYLVWYDQ